MNRLVGSSATPFIRKPPSRVDGKRKKISHADAVRDILRQEYPDSWRGKAVDFRDAIRDAARSTRTGLQARGEDPNKSWKALNQNEKKIAFMLTKQELERRRLNHVVDRFEGDWVLKAYVRTTWGSLLRPRKEKSSTTGKQVHLNASIL